MGIGHGVFRTVGFAGVLFLAAGSQDRAGAVIDRIIGAESPTGGAYLLKRFSVPGGATIAGIEFLNNDPQTVFPKVQLLQGPLETIRGATVLAEFTKVQPVTAHRVHVAFSSVEVFSPAEVYIAVEFPPSAGVQSTGVGDGIAGTSLETPRDSFFAGGDDGALGAMYVDYAMNLVFQVAGKAAPTSGQANEPENALAQTFLKMGTGNPVNWLTAVQYGVERLMPVT